MQRSAQRWTRLAIHHEQTISNHGRTGITAMDADTPAHRKSIGGKTVDDALFPPDAIALRPQPLGPVIGLGKACGQKSSGKEEEVLQCGFHH